MVLEPIYEQDFLDCSYGFRPGRGAHQALAGYTTLGSDRDMTEVETPTYFLPSRPTGPVVVVTAAINAVLAGLLFVLARQLGWTLGGAYVDLFAANFAICLACVLRWNPLLIGRRMHIGTGTKPWDIVWLVVFAAIMAPICIVVIGALDRQAGITDPPGIAWLTGAVIFVSGWMLLTWSMVANPFFEKTVRIQTDHGHHVVDRGPYACIRHPGYVGFSTVFLATPLLLASASILLPVLMAVLAFLIRTVMEDRTLRAELDGYAEYAARVRFRLIPGVW